MTRMFSKRARTRLVVLAAVGAAGLLLFVSGALAVHEGVFQLDGDTSLTDIAPITGVSRPYDWNDLFTATGATASSLPAGFTDARLTKDFRTKANGTFDTADFSTYTGGSKDTLEINTGWRCVGENNVTQKGDITNAYATEYVSAGDRIVYFGVEKYAPQGTNNVGIWLLQDPTAGCQEPTSTGGNGTLFTGTHMNGDLFIVSAFDNGGKVSDIRVFQWLNGGLTAVTTGLDCRDDLAGGDSVCAVANKAAVAIKWPHASNADGNKEAAGTRDIPAATFYEGGVNLSRYPEFAGKCFTRFIFNTRSSTSETATLYDYALGSLNTCAKVTIRKKTLGGSGSFDFTATPALGVSSPSFSLTTTAPGDPGIASKMFEGVQPGTYAVRELVPGGWNLSNLTCTASGPGSSAVRDGTDPTKANITVGFGGDVTCTYEDTLRAPALSITKTADATPVNAGDPIGFTITVANSNAAGTGTANGVTLSDPLPSGVTWSISPTTAGCSISGTTTQTLSCSFGNLAPGDSRMVHVTATTSFAACATYPNTATAQATNHGPVTASATIVCQKPALTITKTPDGQTVDAGDPISFSITVANSNAVGTGTAKNVTLNDPLPLGVTWSTSSADCSIAPDARPGQTLTCSFGNLAAGASRSATVSAQTSFDACAAYNNTATASASNHPNVSDPGSILCRKPLLTITKTPDGQTVDAGDPISFTITVANSGAAGTGTAKGVTLNDPLPAGVTWTTSSANCSVSTGSPQTLSCSFGDLAPGASRTAVVSAQTSFDACATYNNTATASASNHPNVSDPGSIVCRKPDLTITKTAANTPVDAGDPISFTITVTNNGPGTAKSVTLSDPLPLGVGWSTSSSGCQLLLDNRPGQTLSCSYGDLTAGQSRTATVTAQTSFAECATYPNTATASASNHPDRSASATIVCLKPDLQITKTADATSVNAGDPIGFTITVTNNGPGTAKSVTLTDPLPAGVIWSISPANAACSIGAPGQTLSCSFGNLASGATRSVHVSAQTSSANCATYDNTATVHATNHPDRSDSASIVCRSPGLTITKTADAASVDAGDQIGFTITLTNTGAGTATGAKIDDDLPGGSGAGVSPVTWAIASSSGATCTLTGAAGSQHLTCGPATLATGQSIMAHLTATTSFDACGQYDNTATYTTTNDGSGSASASITCKRPSLAITKTADASPVDAGDAIGFSITVSNAGPGTAKSVTLSDPLPAGVAWSISPANADCSIAGTSPQMLSCSFGDLAASQSRTVHLTATTSFAACATYPNTATAHASNHPDRSASATIVCLKPDLTITKTAANTPVDAGDPISFTITVTNNGPGTAKNVALSDPLPAGVTWSTSSPDCSIAGTSPQLLSCSFGDLAADHLRAATVSAETSFEACATYPNTATAHASNHPDRSASATIVCLKPDLRITKTAANTPVDAGDPISFTITVSNAGPGTAKGVTLSDPLPQGVTWSTSSAGCSLQADGRPGQTLLCSFGDLSAGQSGTATVSAQTSFLACATYPNTATARADNHPVVFDSATIVCRKPALTITKTPDGQTVDAGDAISFSITVANSGAAGTGTAKDVMLSDPLPLGVTWSTTSADCSIAPDARPGQTLTCSFGNLAAGASRSATVSAQTTFDACAAYNNTATASASNHPNVSDPGSILCRKPDLTITKTAANTPVNAGDPISFSITVSNAGPGTAKGVTLSDPLPLGVTWSTSSANCSIAPDARPGQTLSCTYGDLAAGQSRTATVNAQTSSANCATYDNTATVHSTNHPDRSDSASIVCRSPGLNLTKTADAASVDAGDQIGFTITLANTGAGTATGAKIDDDLPGGSGAGVSPVTWTIASSSGATCTLTGAAGSQHLTCGPATLANGDSITAHLTATTSFDACGQYNNTATYTTTNNGSGSASASITCRRPALSITKTPDGQTVNAGDPISFTITVANSGAAGTGTAKSVTLNDPLPAGVTWSTSSANCSVSSGSPQTLSCSFGDLAPGASRTATVSAQTSFAACATYNNTATASASNHPNVSDPGSIVCQKPNLTITKTADSASVGAGSPIGFTITVSNAGPGTASGVTLSDPLPGGSGVDWSIESQPAGNPCSISGSPPTETLSCSFGALAASTSRQVHVTSPTTSSSCQAYPNTATASATNHANVQATATTTVTCAVALPCPAGLFLAGAGTASNPTGDLRIAYDQFPAPNDNSYGVNAAGWGGPGKHKFNDLTGSDHAGFQIIRPAGTVALSFAVDYISSKSGTPSGYGSLGPFGGDGKILTQSSPALTAAGIDYDTSLSRNLNNTGYFVGGVQQSGHQTATNGANLLLDSPPVTGVNPGDSPTIVNNRPNDGGQYEFKTPNPWTPLYSNPEYDAMDLSGSLDFGEGPIPVASLVARDVRGWNFHDTFFVTLKRAYLTSIGFEFGNWEFAQQGQCSARGANAKWCVTPNDSVLHNSPAKPCPVKPIRASDIQITKYEPKDQQVKITILNNHEFSPTFITDILNLTWPQANGNLIQVKLDGDTVWNGSIPWSAGGVANLATVPTWNADPNKRKIDKHTSDVLAFIFQNKPVATPLTSGYTATVRFDDSFNIQVLPQP